MNPVLHRMPQALTGDRSRLTGNCSGLSGDCSGLSGDCSGLRGDCTGLRGNCTGLRGNLDDAGLTDIERAAGVSISDLIIRDAQATGV